MTDSYDEIEARIQAALAFISREENSNIAKLAWDYTVSVSRLQAHAKNERIDQIVKKKTAVYLIIKN